ncbi:unnamed protein product [Miscanthus lutarioriparius]|uniref:Uncharacterized protein n=1 Tax=Miscanthus lutarioriparius TaxID=422564 RepID=A0A811SM05_9POAL|nr:unnamed protein product [Miscanthus lutarioriparius]
MPNDARRGARGVRRAHVELEERAIAQAAMGEAEREDEILAAAEAPLPHYLATDSEYSDEDDDYSPSEFVVLMMMRRVLETQQVILDGMRQQQEAQRQQMLTGQMFSFLSGCLGQLYCHTGLEPPPLPTTQQIQHEPTAPAPPVVGFVQTPLATDPVSPLLQTGMLSLPQTTEPQLTQSPASSPEQPRQGEFTSPMSTQVSAPFSTAPLLSEETPPQPSDLPAPRSSSPLPSFVTPRSEGLDEPDAALRTVTQQIQAEMASEVEGTVSSPLPEGGMPASPRVDPALPESSPSISGFSSDAEASAYVVQPSGSAASASSPKGE